MGERIENIIWNKRTEGKEGIVKETMNELLPILNDIRSRSAILMIYFSSSISKFTCHFKTKICGTVRYICIGKK